MSDKNDFYKVLERYAEVHKDNEGMLSVNVFCILHELSELIQNKPVTDVIDFVEKNQTYAEAYSASISLEGEYSGAAYLLQVHCLIEGWGCEGNAEDKAIAREKLEDRFEFLKTQANQSKDIEAIEELLYCYEHYVLARDLPPSEINKIHMPYSDPEDLENPDDHPLSQHEFRLSELKQLYKKLTQDKESEGKSIQNL